jgi:hypothetical protein
LCSKAIEICRIVAADIDGSFFTPWDYGSLLDTAIENEEIRAIVFLLEKIKFELFFFLFVESV